MKCKHFGIESEKEIINCLIVSTTVANMRDTYMHACVMKAELQQ